MYVFEYVFVLYICNISHQTNIFVPLECREPVTVSSRLDTHCPALRNTVMMERVHPLLLLPCMTAEFTVCPAQLDHLAAVNLGSPEVCSGPARASPSCGELAGLHFFLERGSVALTLTASRLQASCVSCSFFLFTRKKTRKVMMQNVKTR